MRKFLLIVVAVAFAALPALAFAHGSSARSSAEKQCRFERTHMGLATFKTTYGSGKSHKNAFGKCVSHRTNQNSSDEGNAQTSAEKQCKALQAADPTVFKNTWGTNHNKSNAFGKCVSSKAKEQSESTENKQVSDEDAAAAQCRSDESSDAATFKSKFGTKSDAFGKCVSQTAKQEEESSS